MCSNYHVLSIYYEYFIEWAKKTLSNEQITYLLYDVLHSNSMLETNKEYIHNFCEESIILKNNKYKLLVDIFDTK